jgi:hypothetical protein
MATFLKGNYRLPKGRGTLVTGSSKKDLTDEFEESALAKLGGSLCFVMKKGAFIWTDPSADAPPRETTR